MLCLGPGAARLRATAEFSSPRSLQGCSRARDVEKPRTLLGTDPGYQDTWRRTRGGQHRPQLLVVLPAGVEPLSVPSCGAGPLHATRLSCVQAGQGGWSWTPRPCVASQADALPVLTERWSALSAPPSPAGTGRVPVAGEPQGGHRHVSHVTMSPSTWWQRWPRHCVSTGTGTGRHLDTRPSASQHPWP